MAPDAPATAASSSYTDLLMKVYYTDGIVSREACMGIVPALDLDDHHLADLRDDIEMASDKKESALLGFCSKSGANVPDTFSIRDYLANGLGADASKRITELTIYLRKDGLVSMDTTMGGETASLGQYIDANKLAWLKQTFDENAFKLLTGTAAKYVAELEEQEWSVVADSNALCFGSRIIYEKHKGKKVAVGIERAPYPAFRLKKRRILSDTLTSTSVKDVEMELRIPDYRMDDQSYVSTMVLENRMQASMAESSYSQTDIAAAASGSMWGVGASAGGELGLSSSQAASGGSETSSKQVTISYNFPRVTIILDPENLELTTECQARLTSALASENIDVVKKFLEDYGEIFSTRVQLGGRLFASEHVESGSHKEALDLAKSMKASASASFSGWGAEVSVSASHQNKSSTSDTRSSSTSSMALAWQATGGDTLLCNDPTAWCSSVAYHWNWRITKKDKVIPMVEKLSKFRGFETLPDKIHEWDADYARNAESEARRAKEKKDKEFKDAVDAAVADITASYQRFYLPEDKQESRHLRVYTASEKSLDALAKVWNRAEGKTAIKRTAALKSRGVCCMEQERESMRHVFQAETLDGKPVRQVCYGEYYRIVNRSTKLYLDYHGNNGQRLPFGNTVKGTPIQFKDHDKKVTAGPVPAKAMVDIEFFYAEKDLQSKGCLRDTYLEGYRIYLKLDEKYSKPVMFKPVT